jgi:signal recognition particle subunit SRP54
MEQEEAEKLASKMQQAKFDLEDFLTQMRRMRKIGSLESILKLVPGMGGMVKKMGDMQVPEKEIDRAEAIISSMTKKERQEPSLINASRRARIAKGCGMTVAEVSALLKNFDQMNKMMQQMLGGGGKTPKMPKMPGMPAGYTPPGTRPQGALRPGMQNSMAEAMQGMPGMPEMHDSDAGGKKQLSKKTLAERKKKKMNKKQRKKR